MSRSGKIFWIVCPVSIMDSFVMPLRYTPLMKKRITRRAESMLRQALSLFPELGDQTITVGFTRAHLGSAILQRSPSAHEKLTIRLKVRKLTYNTIGHELTHLVQGLSGRNPAERNSHIPTGEKQCDIWTLARSELFCDDAPTYLKLKKDIRKNWSRYAGSVRALCIAAIEKRKTHRLYIQWLEAEIKNLGKKRPPKQKSDLQLELPF
jgi:hypothetical protein